MRRTKLNTKPQDFTVVSEFQTGMPTSEWRRLMQQLLAPKSQYPARHEPAEGNPDNSEE